MGALVLRALGQQGLLHLLSEEIDRPIHRRPILCGAFEQLRLYHSASPLLDGVRVTSATKHKKTTQNQ